MAAGDLTDLDTVKAWLGPNIGTASDDVLSRLITACSAYIQSWLNRTIALTDYTDAYDGQNNQRIQLREYPIANVTAVTVDGVAIPQRAPLGSGTGFGFVFDGDSVMLAGWTFNRGWQNCVVSYSAGYATVPPDIEQACIDMIGDWFKYRSRIGKTSEAIEGQSISFTNTSMPARTRDTLMQYRKVVTL